MSALTFKFKIKDKLRLDMSWLSTIDSASLDVLNKKNIMYGNKMYNISKLFSISGNDCDNIKILNSNDCLDNIGNNLSNKVITIEGNVGLGLGRGMNSGIINLKGNAGEGACSGMKGGSVFIDGNASNRFCCLPTGRSEGFVDGFVYVKKNVGSNSISRMRRGNIIIGGNIGNNSCYQMISGSVTILGKIGKDFGLDARRGTFIVKDKSLCKNYINANVTDLTYYNFYKSQVNSILRKSIYGSKEPKRYFGHKKNKELIELFVL